MFSKAPFDGKDDRLGVYDHIIVHCTATPPNVNANAAWVNNAHIQRGFSGGGYHAVITRHGDWEDNDDGFPTRKIGRPGAHVGDCGIGWNTRSFGISLAGGVDSDNIPHFNYTEDQIWMLEQGINGFLRLHPNPENVVLMGHRDLIARCGAPPKACPCFDVQYWWTNDLGRRLGTSNFISPRKVIPFKDDHEDHAAPSNIKVPSVYVVKNGDTLSGIAHLLGVQLSTLRLLNNKNDESIIVAGERLTLP